MAPPKKPRIDVAEKTCTKCKRTQPITVFAKTHRTADGHLSWCASCCAAKSKAWYEANKERHSYAARAYQRTLRAQVLLKFGCKCAECGYSDRRALQVDHVHNDGADERYPNRSSAYYLKNKASHVGIMRKALRDTEGRYQLLCANCNMIKKYENDRRRIASDARFAKFGGET